MSEKGWPTSSLDWGALKYTTHVDTAVKDGRPELFVVQYWPVKPSKPQRRLFDGPRGKLLAYHLWKFQPKRIKRAL